MGFWDVGIGDLEAIGVPVSEAQRVALHQGGEVLLIQHLLSPTAYDGDNNGTWDQEDKPVFVPQTMTCGTPGQAHDELDDWFGKIWRTWPSYTGYLDEPLVDSRMWNESITYMRVWEGLPLLEPGDHDIVKRLSKAAQVRIRESVYEEICALCEFETCGEYGWGLDDLLPIVDMLADNPDPDICDLKDFKEAEDLDHLVYISRIIKELLEGNYISFDNYTIHSDHPHKDLSPLTFKPMSFYLADDHEALAVWNRLVNRRENALAVIAGSLPQGLSYVFDHHERST